MKPKRYPSTKKTNNEEKTHDQRYYALYDSDREKYINLNFSSIYINYSEQIVHSEDLNKVMQYKKNIEKHNRDIKIEMQEFKQILVPSSNPVLDDYNIISNQFAPVLRHDDFMNKINSSKARYMIFVYIKKVLFETNLKKIRKRINEIKPYLKTHYFSFFLSSSSAYVIFSNDLTLAAMIQLNKDDDFSVIVYDKIDKKFINN